MGETRMPSFEDFFMALWGHPPFAWQAALAEQVLAGGHGDNAQAWPEAIALPTASGKTACIDIAVFALAMQGERSPDNGPPTAPRRIFFVVDRRVIVDEALDRAKQIASMLQHARDGVLKAVADRLRRIADGPLPLAVQALRGGQLRSDEWAASPMQPTVIASTVDQVGSRLLFRGYGVGQGMWPIHAGLVGNDALILLDEAHCAQPMLQTLQAVQRYRRVCTQPVPVPFELAVLSATPPPGLRSVFRDTSPQARDPAHPLGRRQLASKPSRLVLAGKGKGRSAAAVRMELAAALAEQAQQLSAASLVTAGDASAPATVVFCNRVDTARRVHGLLSKHCQDVSLLTGRMRPIDKDDIVAQALAPLGTRQAASRRLAAPCFVVATQTLEVGADLDFDLLITECASLDALRQRFGRLNRGGRAIEARAVIVAAAAQLEDDAEDPVYGLALSKTWSTLQAWAAHDGMVDFGIAAMAPRLASIDDPSALEAPAAEAPVLLPAHLDALAQTSPVPMPSPDVGLFLHGPRSGPADVQVCWRSDLDLEDLAAALDTLLRCPPSSPECLAVPYAQMRRWLDGLPISAGADIEGVANDDEKEDPPPPARSLRQILRWRGRDDSGVISSDELRPGDLVVVPAKLGGFDELATLGAEPVADWGDRAHAAMRGRAQLRLHPAVVARWPGGAARQHLDACIGQSREAWEEDPAGFAAELREALARWLPALDLSAWVWLRDIVDQCLKCRRLDRALSPHPLGGWIVELPVSKREPEGMANAATVLFFSDEDDAASSGHFQSLLVQAMCDGRSHLEGVGALARSYAQRMGLATPWVEAVGLAADGHDLGKADPRFQAWLRGGTPWAVGPLLAKSAQMPQSRAANHAARQRAGYPEGGRHELLSVRLLESVPERLPSDPALRELVLHLVESHHGQCRPFARVVRDEAPVTVTVQSAGCTYTASSDTRLERLDAGPADRYWRLTRRHGWWGLAWLETLMRLADHRRSAWEQQQAGED